MAMKLILRRRTRNHTRRQAPRRAGMSIVEIIVAMMLFGTTTIAMAGLSLAVARRAEANALLTKRTALLQQQMNRLQALPYQSLTSAAGTVTVADASLPHKRKITIITSGSRTRVTVQIIPSRAPASTESVTFDRAVPTTSPLCKGC
jgi:type II secretory pathway pseudopilin PulG